MGTTEKTNRTIFYILNLAVILPYIIRNYSLEGVVITTGVLLVLLYYMVLKKQDTVSASAYITELFFADAVVWAGFHLLELKLSFSGEMIFKYLERMSGGVLVILIIVCAIGVITKKSRVWWLNGIGAVVIGEAFIFTGWTNLTYGDLKFAYGGKVLAICYLWAVVFWMLSSRISGTISVERQRTNKRMGWLLLIGVIFLLTCNMSYVQDNLSVLVNLCNRLSETVFAWWRVFLAVGILLSATVMMYDSKRKKLSVDGFVCGSIAVIVLCVRLLMSNYFCYSWIVLAVLLGVLTHAIVKKIGGENKFFNHSDVEFLLRITICQWLVIWLIYMGMWVNLVTGAAFLMVFYLQRNRFQEEGYRGSLFWILILTAIASETAVWMWKYRFSKEGMILLLLAFFFAIVVMSVINTRHPNGVKANNYLRSTVALILLLICLLDMRKYGSRVEVEFNSQKTQATVSVSVRGKDNVQKRAYYYWLDAKGARIGTEKNVGKTGIVSVPSSGKILKVIVKDKYGIQTTSTFWCPNGETE